MARLTPAGSAIHDFVVEYGLVVRSGPFAGMRFPRAADGHASFLAAKLLGAYECELHHVLEPALRGRSRQIVDIGAADGYYVVGAALRTSPAVHVTAFESDAGGRSLCHAMAVLNDVEARISIGGTCDPESLAAILAPGAFVMCDCEGYEQELLDPTLVPALRTSHILAELQPVARPGIETSIVERFCSTHEVTLVESVPRRPEDWPELSRRDRRTSFLLLSEGAPTEARLPEFRRLWANMLPRTP